MDAERAWESLTLEDHKRLSSAFLAGGAGAGARFLGKQAFLLGWQAATERAANIVEEADWQPIALLGKDGLNNLSKAIRQQESADGN